MISHATKAHAVPWSAKCWRVMAPLAVLALLLWPESAEACAVCFGDPDSAMVHGLNKGILTLLGFIALVQVGIVRVAWTMHKRGKEHQLGLTEPSLQASASDNRKG